MRRLALLPLVLALAGVPADAHAASVAQRMVSIARAELGKGVREAPEGSNRGTRIRAYGLSTTPRFYPAPWCAYFVSWVARGAGRPLGPSGQGFGYVPYLRAWALRAGAWKRTPRSGDLIMFPQHVGLVEKVYANGTLTTIEGNSSNRVARRWRRWREASGYVRVAAGGTVSPGAAPSPGASARPVRAALKARISTYPGTTVAVGQAVGFSANDSSGDIARYRWDLDGDGAYDDARGDNAERTYARPAVVRVGLKLTDRRGRSHTARTTVTVRLNEAPVPRLELPDTAALGARFTVSAAGSRDPDGDIERFEWDLEGDGSFVPGGPRQELRLTTPGTHAIGLRVVDDRGAVAEIARTVVVTQRPPAARIAAPATTALGAATVLDGSRSSDPDGEVVAWRWDLDGDGADDAAGPRPEWRPSVPGRRTIRLTVTDRWGAEATATHTLTVTNATPTARIAVPALPVAGTTLTFGGGGSTDPDAAITAWEWDLDDDGDVDATGPAAAARFDGTGDRRVRLRVTDAWGAQHTTSATFRLLQRPAARLSASTLAPTAGALVTFNASSSTDADGTIERLDWDFGADGVVDLTTARRTTTVSWSFPAAGATTVRLTVTDSHGLQSSTDLPLAVR